MAPLARRAPARRPAPAQRAHGDRGRHRPRRGERRRDPRRDGLPGGVLLLPGQRPARPLDRRPGRDQRDQGLRERGRLGAPAVRRHDQGRRLPRPRGERLAARRAVDEHHRPGGGPGRPLQPRVRRAARHALVRRRARRAHLLLPWPDRAAAPARRLWRAPEAGRGRPGGRPQPPRDARAGDRRRAGPRDRGARPGQRLDQRPRGRGGSAGERRLLQRLLPLHQRDGMQRDRDLACPQARRRDGQPLLHPDSSHLHPPERRLSIEADPDERVASQRRPHLGAPRSRRGTGAERYPGGRALLLPRGALPEVRQPRPPRRRLPEREAGLRRGAGGRPHGPRGLPRLPRRDRPGGPAGDRPPLREPLRAL